MFEEPPKKMMSLLSDKREQALGAVLTKSWLETETGSHLAVLKELRSTLPRSMTSMQFWAEGIVSPLKI